MTFSSTVQLQIFGDHLLDKKVESPEKNDNNNSEPQCTSDGKWASLKREDSSLLSTQNTADTTNTVTMVSCATSAHSDWHAIASNSFDETYLESGYGSGTGGMSISSSSSSLGHLNEPMNKLALENEEHDMPVISMPYPGSSWYMGNKSENGFSLPSLGGLTLRSQGSNVMTNENVASTCSPCIRSNSLDYSFTTGHVPNDGPCSGVSLSLEPLTPGMSQTLEPAELLFEDMNPWSNHVSDSYENQHYSQPPQPVYNVTPYPSTLNGYLYFDGITNNNNTTATCLYDYAPPFQHHQLPSSNCASPLMYRMIQPQDVYPTETWSSNQVPPFYSTPSTATTTPVELLPQQYNGCDQYVSAGPMKRMLRSSTLHQRQMDHPSNDDKGLVNSNTLSTTNTTTSNQSSKIQLLTALSDCYWKNGRKNLQCFPSCPEHHDFYSMKMNNRKHSSVGVCRGPVYCHAFTDAADFLPAASTQHMKQENGLGLSKRNNARELFVLGRFERVPQQDTTNLLEELNPPPTFSNAAVFEPFRFTCFQAVEMEERRILLPQEIDDTSKATSTILTDSKRQFLRSTWFFLPDVWKVQPMLKKKRKATRSAPAQTFPFCFRIFIYTRDLNGPGYSCIADTASSFFELYSTRTVDRVKRKYWSSDSMSDQRPAKQRGF
ncbi:uncharacterized protein PHALS_02984 [Plasmopara halstedii]|uniref:Uncharacterized protein n=1 Tax=Plasmopara halstedii TaxID=4781 RepID=A0A0N7L7B1_PLAHL|nr:uncharacterized protein PHALS_02984 [Plasmopara halstedii]CEG46579.1 hypothetical protein PHALS_02984 [Plasmopara halstedii]|eukprot:XP_024582948.1 hypothetical protein PHALS_02984 [Plasmopara halstedii]